MNKELTPLVALKRIKKGGREDDDFGWLSNEYLFDKEIKVIEQALKAYNKLCQEKLEWLEQKQVLDIIKDKQVSVGTLLVLDNLQQYNDYCDMVGGCKKLTEEEYYKVKKVLL